MTACRGDGWAPGRALPDVVDRVNRGRRSWRLALLLLIRLEKSWTIETVQLDGPKDGEVLV